MRRPSLLFSFASATLGLGLVAAAAACDKTDPDSYLPPVPPGSGCANLARAEGYVDALKCAEHKSCAFHCTGCAEHEQPYSCPALNPWGAMPHGVSCGAFDGKTTPAPVTRKCTAGAPTGEALARAGAHPTIAKRWVLPDGHWIQPEGSEQEIRAAAQQSGFPLQLLLVPGTRFALVSDTGADQSVLHVVDLDRVASGAPALVASQPFDDPAQLFDGLAFVPPNRIYASGGARGFLYSLTINLQTGALTRTATSDVDLGPGADTSSGVGRYFAGPVVANADASRIVVAPSTVDRGLRVVDVATRQTTSVDLGTSELFAMARDPFNPAGQTYWITALSARHLLRVDLASAKVTGRFAAGKNPEGIALLEGTHVAVASSDDDRIAVYTAATGQEVQSLRVTVDAPLGAQPGVLAYDTTRKRLYATLSGINAIGVYAFDAQASAPLVPMGKIPTAWWPTALHVRADGSLVVLTGRGHGTGAGKVQHKPGGGGEVVDLTRGSIQIVPLLSPADLARTSAVVDASRKSGAAEGYPEVSCAGAPYDFPIPTTNTGAPSADIQHVVFVVRENKTFDAVFGDLAGIKGDPALVMAPGKMEEYWKNMRSLARTFANFDNYYTDAEQSIQGHVWTAFGRTSDYVERTWTSMAGRDLYRKPKIGIDPVVGYPGEGSLFMWAEKHGISYDDMGEIIGMGKNGFDPRYPGFVYTVGLPDVEKACYIAARARALCDLKAITYVVLPNDHTQGLKGGAPAPEVMIAVNDEATGMIVDAISHSPMWPKTLIVITEDDPQSGGDHVDPHRTPFVLVSPWIKRTYVSSTHIDTASVHKLIAHVFAKPYLSETIANAAIPYDAFSPTPDYTPYKYTPRTTRSYCNASGTSGARAAEGWDFGDPDDQPGLDDQVAEHMRSLSR